MEAPENFHVNITWDDEAGVWVAISDDIPLALESSSFDLLIERVKAAAPEILALNYADYASAGLLIRSEMLIKNG